MNCETAFRIPRCLVGACRSVEDPRGARHWRGSRAAHLYAVGSFDPDHDAVMRIGGEAPGGGPILSVGISARFEYGFPPPRIVNSAVVLKSQRERRMVLSAMLVHISPFRTLDVRRRPPMGRQW